MLSVFFSLDHNIMLFMKNWRNLSFNYRQVPTLYVSCEQQAAIVGQWRACILTNYDFVLFQCNSKLTEKLHDAEVQLKQQPASTHTMQAILEAKVRIWIQKARSYGTPSCWKMWNNSENLSRSATKPWVPTEDSYQSPHGYMGSQGPKASSYEQQRLMGLMWFCIFSSCPSSNVGKNKLSLRMTKPTKWTVRLVKTQISLGIRPVRSESSLCA